MLTIARSAKAKFSVSNRSKAIRKGSRFMSAGRTSPTVPFSSIFTPKESADVSSGVKITRLDNGLRVVTTKNLSPVSNIGVFVETGSRYEVPATAGLAHFVERLSFQGTDSYNSSAIHNTMSALGANVSVAASRENITYTAEVLANNVDPVLNMLSSMVLSPSFIDHEIEAECERYLEFLNEYHKNPEVVEAGIYGAAFFNNTLGLPLVAPTANLRRFGPRMLDAHRGLFYQPDRIVVAGVGVDHDSFVKSVESQFKDFAEPDPLLNFRLHQDKAISELSQLPDSAELKKFKELLKQRNAAAVNNNPDEDQRLSTELNLEFDRLANADAKRFAHYLKTKQAAEAAGLKPLEFTIPQLFNSRTAQYTGGEVRLPSQDSPGVVDFAVAFKTASWHSKDLVPMCVLGTLLGGGSSFSAGGPGKGMHSRLYRNVLNGYEFVESASSFNLIHSDHSLFGIHASGSARAAHRLVLVVAETFRAMEKVTNEELVRARNQLKSSIFMKLENRNMLLEDIGMQTLHYNKVTSPSELAAQIDAVTADDLKRVTRDMLATKPSVAVSGDTNAFPPFEEVARRFKA